MTAAARPRRARAPELIDRFHLIDAPGHLLRRVHQRSFDIFTAAVGRAGPTRVQYAILLSLHQSPGISLSQLAARTGIDRNTLGDVLRRLVRKRWVQRSRNPTDGRAYAISITAPGRNLIRALSPAVVAAQREILGPLNRREQAQFVALLQRLAGLAPAPVITSQSNGRMIRPAQGNRRARRQTRAAATAGASG